METALSFRRKMNSYICWFLLRVMIVFGIGCLCLARHDKSALSQYCLLRVLYPLSAPEVQNSRRFVFWSLGIGSSSNQMSF